jgi:hypothetical protein
MGVLTSNKAILFTDICGSSRLWNAHHDAMYVALKTQERFLFSTCSGNGGTVLKTIGDAFMMSFDTLDAALKTAIKIQRRMQAKPIRVSPRDVIQLRVGISYGQVVPCSMHVGNAEQQHVLPDLYGKTVNLASRAESVACNPGGIAIGLLKSDPQFALSVAACAHIAKKSIDVVRRTVCAHNEASNKNSGRRSGRLLSAPSTAAAVHGAIKGFRADDVEFICLSV